MGERMIEDEREVEINPDPGSNCGGPYIV